MIFGMMDEFEDDKNKEDAAGNCKRWRMMIHFLTVATYWGNIFRLKKIIYYITLLGTVLNDS